MICLVNYDLKSGENRSLDYQYLKEQINSLGHCLHIQKSSWLVDTDMTFEDICRSLIAYVEAEDNLIVVEVGKEYFGKGRDWIDNRLKAKEAGYFVRDDGTWWKYNSM